MVMRPHKKVKPMQACNDDRESEGDGGGDSISDGGFGSSSDSDMVPITKAGNEDHAGQADAENQIVPLPPNRRVQARSLLRVRPRGGPSR